MTAKHIKYSLGNSDNLEQSIQMQLSKKQKTLSECFATFASFLFLKDVVRKMPTKPGFKHNSTVNMLNGSKQCRNLHGTTSS